MTTAQIQAIVATTTQNTYAYLDAILPYLLVFAVIVGVLFMAIRWVKSTIGGHGQRV